MSDIWALCELFQRAGLRHPILGEPYRPEELRDDVWSICSWIKEASDEDLRPCGEREGLPPLHAVVHSPSAKILPGALVELLTRCFLERCPRPSRIAMLMGVCHCI